MVCNVLSVLHRTLVIDWLKCVESSQRCCVGSCFCTSGPCFIQTCPFLFFFNPHDCYYTPGYSALIRCILGFCWDTPETSQSLFSQNITIKGEVISVIAFSEIEIRSFLTLWSTLNKYFNFVVLFTKLHHILLPSDWNRIHQNIYVVLEPSSVVGCVVAELA